MAAPYGSPSASSVTSEPRWGLGDAVMGWLVAYALLIASNTGNEILGFGLLLVSAGLFAAWAVIDRRWAFLSLQFFYAASAIIGLVRWG